MKRKLYAIALALTFFAQGCNHKKTKVLKSPSLQRSPMDFLKQGPVSFPAFFSMARVQAYINNGQLKEASRYVNQCINTEPRNPALHLLNAFIYESLLESGREDCKEFIDIAYRTAMNLDPSLWLTHHLRGLNALKMGKYPLAQQFFADAISLKPNDPEIIYALAYASYYAYDLPVAVAFIEKAARLCPNEPIIIRAAAMIQAAVGQKNKANEYLNQYQKITGDSESDVQVMKKRLEEWSETHKRLQLMGKGVSSTIGIKSRPDANLAAVQALKSEEKLSESAESIVFDTILLSSNESKGTSMGQNIFNSLQVTLGGSSDTYDNSGSSALAYTPQVTLRNAIGTVNSVITSQNTRTFVYGITPYAMAYSLNIANASQKTTEVLSRATLSTTVGHAAYFLQGQQYTGATTGSLTGASTAAVDAGINVQITPLSISETGEITIALTVSGTNFVAAPIQNSGISNQLIQIEQSKITTTVKAYLGQTIMIGGIQTNSSAKTKSGFPLLSSIPLIQYFTSQAQTLNQKSSAIFLLTPRLGGTARMSSNLEDKPQSLSPALCKRGLMSIGEYPNAYYILKHLTSYGMFAQFRSGDLASPTLQQDQKTLSRKITQLMSFAWY